MTSVFEKGLLFLTLIELAFGLIQSALSTLLLSIDAFRNADQL